jgi:hypothetical protein
MADNLIFISYKHEAPWSEMAAAFYLKLKNVASALGFEVFIDKTMLASAEWRDELDQRLERTTHLVAFLCDPYWASEECKRELHAVLKRYEAARAAKQPGPRLLFVRAGNIDPRFFTFDEARKTGVLSSTDSRIGKIGDVNFLGPYDLENNGKLEVLARNDPAKLDDQLAQLFERLRATLA